MLKRVVVTGLGALTPIGNNIIEYWNSLSKGVSGAKEITKFDASEFKTKFACEIKNYNPDHHFDKKTYRKLDLFSQYALITAEEAIKDSGIPLEKIDLEKVGVIWASGIGGFTSFQDELEKYFQNHKHPKFNPFFITKIIPNIASGLIAIKYGFKGVNFIVTSACASSTHAIIDAFNYIRLGKASIIVTGGSEAPIIEAAVGGFNAMKALSERNASPQEASRPFDKNRDGFALGEGAGALVLEEFEHAKARGAKIYAEIVGTGFSDDAYHMAAPEPNGEGVYLSMKAAIEEANIHPGEIDYINAHATSTPLGDLCELKAIHKLFQGDIANINISSTKSMTGHLLGAAGAIEAIASILALKNNIIPPTINCTDVDEEIDSSINLTIGGSVSRKVDYAMSNNFGFGGHNATIIMKKCE